MEDKKRRASVEALRQLVYNAHRNISFDPERAQRLTLDGIDQELDELLGVCPDELKSEYEQKYIALNVRWLNSMSRCASSAVVGPARFPVARMEKYNKWERHAREYLDMWREKVIKRMTKQKRLKGWAEIERLQEKVDQLKEAQEKMKQVNKLLRLKSLDDDEKKDELQNMGFSDREIDKLMDDSNWWGRGFASFSLSNNLAKIKDAEARIARLVKIANSDEKEYEFDWGKVVLATQDERLRLVFNDIPSAEIRDALKHSGWKWSRANGAWQRVLNSNAIYSAKRIMKIETEIRL